MTDAFQQWIPFNPMRFREEIKAVELSNDRLESLLKQYETHITIRVHEVLSREIREESVYLTNVWQLLEDKLQKIEKAEIPYYFLRKEIKEKVEHLLQEANKINNFHSMCST